MKGEDCGVKGTLILKGATGEPSLSSVRGVSGFWGFWGLGSAWDDGYSESCDFSMSLKV